jgi:tetratricopeptide (TPR) repeat protein
VFANPIRYRVPVECPTESQVVAFVGGAPFAQRDAVVEHVDECASCRTLLAGLVRDDEVRVWRAGERIGRYVIGEPIGRGGMGSVWRAEDVDLGRAVALKRLHAGGHDRLVREGRTLAQLQHPNVVTVYEVVAEEPPFLAMELVDGVTLTQWLKTERTWQAIVAMVAQAGRGLAAAHARGLVHRDFKPDNVLVDREDRARVADFGLASTSIGDIPLGCKLVRATASMSGTPAYMAPELVDGESPDARSDIYAFAVTLFEALHGNHPFAGGTVETIWIEMAAGRIRDGGNRVPAWLERAVRRGLAVDPHDRWPDVASFVAAIDRKPRRKYIAAAALGGFAVASVAAFALVPAQADDCASGADQVDRVWNPIARTQVASALAVDTAIGESTERIVDHWVVDWRTDRRAACSASQHRVARISCLDHQLDELRDQVTTWSKSPDIDRAISAAIGLPSPTACNTTDDTPLIAQPIVLRIATLKALWRNGKAAEAAPQLPALLRDATAIGHHDTLASALLTASMIEMELGDSDAVASHAPRAATEASKAGDDALLFTALIYQAYNRTDTGAFGDALGLCDAAEAIGARGVPFPEKVFIARAGALMRLGKIPEAIAQYQRAIAMTEPRAAEDPIVHISLGTAVAGLGNAYTEAADYDKAIAAEQRALALQLADYGPRHPEIARTYHDLGAAEAGVKKFADARTHFVKSREILVAAFGEGNPEVGENDLALADIEMHAANYDEAVKLLDRANAELSRVMPPTSGVFPVIQGLLGEVEQNRDHCDAAIPHYEAAYRMLLATHAGGIELSNVDGGYAACLLDRGRIFDAKARAEDALEQLQRAGVTNDHARIEAWYVLAITNDAKGDRATAIKYARLVLANPEVIADGPHNDMRVELQAKLRAWHVTAS